MFKKTEYCPYSEICNGFVGGITCLDGNWVKCHIYKDLKVYLKYKKED